MLRVLRGGPELVVEVRSPSNRRAQGRRKRALYFANNVQMVWDVDEERQVMWVYHAEAPDEPARYDIDDEIDCEPLLPGWRRRVADIFAEQASGEAVVGEVAEEWKAEGMAEGRATTLRAMLPRFVRLRSGSEPPADLSVHLASCDLAQLEVLEAAVETCDSLYAWLALLPATS